MDPLIDLVWRIASGLSLAGLAAALIGLALIAFGLVDYFRKHPDDRDGLAPWRAPYVIMGMMGFFGGIAVSILAFVVRMMGSD